MKRIGYTTKQVSQLTGFSVRQIDYWADQGVVVPSTQKSTGRGSPKIYALDDLVQFRFISMLKTHGWSTQKIREAIVHLREIIDDPYPLRNAIVFDGKSTILALCKTKEGARILLDTLDLGGQHVMPIVLEVLISETYNLATGSADPASTLSETFRYK